MAAKAAAAFAPCKWNIGDAPGPAPHGAKIRDDFRVFRVDHINEALISEDCFEDEPGKSLRDYMKRFQAD